MISNLAYVHPDARLGKDVVVEPFAYIAGDVVIGDGSWIGPNAVVLDGARMGKGCKIHSGAVIAGVPQDLKFKGEYTTVEMGDYNTVRESATVNRGTAAKGKTVIGNNNLIMACAHVAHDCVVGSNCVIVNNVLLAGEVEVGDWAIVSKVEMRNNSPVIILSRTAPEFLERLFEQEVPEIFDGLITIKKIVRIPGERAKVAVESYDERIDPVGACVGMKGSRIYSIVKELRNENIDVVNWTANTQLLIQRALNPAKISSITIDEEKKTASVYLKPSEVSLAIGKGGLNIRLASMLTGYDIDVYRDVEEEDVDLQEFSDEIDQWIIDALKGIGCDTAKSVLEISPDDLVRRTDLEEETIREVISILKSEFE